MKVYKAKEIEVRLKKDSGKVQIHINKGGDAFISLNQFATIVRRVIAAERRRATGGTPKTRPAATPQVVSKETIKALKARQLARQKSA